MSTVQALRSLTSIQDPFGGIRDTFEPSNGASPDAKAIESSLRALQAGLYSPSLPRAKANKNSVQSLAERLYESQAQAKILTANVAMHLDKEWRDKLFTKLDSLLDANEWHEEDKPVTRGSFATFLRMIIYINPKRRPGLGVSTEGNLIAAWTNAKDRLTLEFFPSDKVRWVLSRDIEGERERAAGESFVARLPEILKSYNPDRWFLDADNAAAK